MANRSKREGKSQIGNKLRGRNSFGVQREGSKSGKGVIRGWNSGFEVGRSFLDKRGLATHM